MNTEVYLQDDELKDFDVKNVIKWVGKAQYRRWGIVNEDPFIIVEYDTFEKDNPKPIIFTVDYIHTLQEIKDILNEDFSLNRWQCKTYILNNYC